MGSEAAKKLKHHRLKPGGVFGMLRPVVVVKLKIPPAKAWWCPRDAPLEVVVVKLKQHRLRPGDARDAFPRLKGSAF